MLNSDSNCTPEMPLFCNGTVETVLTESYIRCFSNALGSCMQSEGSNYKVVTLKNSKKPSVRLPLLSRIWNKKVKQILWFSNSYPRNFDCIPLENPMSNSQVTKRIQ